jgi:tRNA 2-thiocytidine biosynthesis protein TtcA
VKRVKKQPAACKMRGHTGSRSRQVVRELSRRERLEFNKLQKRLRRNVGNAIAD